MCGQKTSDIENSMDRLGVETIRGRERRFGHLIVKCQSQMTSVAEFERCPQTFGPCQILALIWWVLQVVRLA